MRKGKKTGVINPSRQVRVRSDVVDQAQEFLVEGESLTDFFSKAAETEIESRKDSGKEGIENADE